MQRSKHCLQLLGWVLFCLAGCAPKPEPLLRIGADVWPGNECFFLARSLGYYERHPIQLVEFASSSEVIRSFQNGAIEAAALTADEMLRLAEQDQDLRAVLVLDISAGADALVCKPGISALGQLKGKRIGVEANSLGSYLLSRCLEIANLRLQDVSVVNLPSHQHARAYEKGEVEALVTFEPHLSKIRAHGGRVLLDSSQLPREIVDFLVVKSETLSTHRRTLASALQGWFQARAHLKNHPADGAARVAPREGLSPEDFLKTLQRLEIPGPSQNRALLSGTDPATAKALEKLRSVMLRHGLLKNAPDVRALLDPALSGSTAE